MKKLILLFVFGCFGLFAFAQVKKVAVYIAGSDPINNILGSRLVDGIAKSGKYVAVERTAAFISELQKEQQYQQSGQVNDDEISRLGKQFGVNYVCVASVFDVWSVKYISVRLIDVETAEVVATASSNGAISNSNELLSALNVVSHGLLSSFEKSKQISAKKVAVYVNKTGNKDVDIILGDQLVAGFAQSGSFFAIERTNSFINQLSKELNYQYTGVVDDSELTRLGRQSGAQYVCVAQTDNLFGDYYISTRLINVETNEIVNSFNKEAVPLSTSHDVVKVTKEIASVLSGMTINEKRIDEERKLSEKCVDLGLPSGTRWARTNEGGYNAYYSYDDAVNRFGDKLPTKEQLEELKKECTWIWTGKGCKVVGPNSNSIYFPAEGGRTCRSKEYSVGSYGYYWSSTPIDSDYAYNLCINSAGAYVSTYHRCVSHSVRLVMD